MPPKKKQKTVPAAKALFDEASEILGYDLLQVCTEGPKEKLDSTVISLTTVETYLGLALQPSKNPT